MPSFEELTTLLDHPSTTSRNSRIYAESPHEEERVLQTFCWT